MPILVNKSGFGYLDTVCLYCGGHAPESHHLYPRNGPDFSNVLEYIAKVCRRDNRIAFDNVFETIGESIDYVQNVLMETGKCLEANLPKICNEVRRVSLVERRSPLRGLASESSVTRLAGTHTMRAYARSKYYDELVQKHLMDLKCNSCSTTSWEYLGNIKNCSRDYCPLVARINEANEKIRLLMLRYDAKYLTPQNTA